MSPLRPGDAFSNLYRQLDGDDAGLHIGLGLHGASPFFEILLSENSASEIVQPALRHVSTAPAFTFVLVFICVSSHSYGRKHARKSITQRRLRPRFAWWL